LQKPPICRGDEFRLRLDTLAFRPFPHGGGPQTLRDPKTRWEWVWTIPTHFPPKFPIEYSTAQRKVPTVAS